MVCIAESGILEFVQLLRKDILGIDMVWDLHVNIVF